MIAPLIGTVSPTRVVEIGALRGHTTAALLDTFGADAQIHVIDPNPQFDPDEHERRFAGRYAFHRDLSLNVLPTLDPVDLALIDGDHNWFTVYNELKLLSAGAEKAAKAAPVFVLHDVAWPYGRRDGYYAPKNVPRRFRQANGQLGIERGRSELCAEGGVNGNIFNAKREGGPRNGVLTALEDFAAEQPDAFRYVVVDQYAGLAVAAGSDRLARHPDLAPFLDRLATDAEQARIAERAKQVVLDAIASGMLSLG